MGQLANIAILGNVEGCEMPMNKQNSSDSFAKVPCCNDVLEIVEATNSELKVANETKLDTFQFAKVFFTSYVLLFDGLPNQLVPFKNHSPPLLIKDIQILYETFLI